MQALGTKVSMTSSALKKMRMVRYLVSLATRANRNGRRPSQLERERNNHAWQNAGLCILDGDLSPEV